MNSSVISVFIADDYIIVREGLKRILKNQKNILVSGESPDLGDLPDKIASCKPDILLMELNLCKLPIKELIFELKERSPTTRVLIVSDCACELPVISSIRGGISGFVKKNVSEEELIKAVTEVAGGKEYFTQEIMQIMIKFSESPSQVFSARELEILCLICKGRSNEQVGDILFISEKTVATHRKNIMRKAGVKKSSELIIWSLENKVV